MLAAQLGPQNPWPRMAKRPLAEVQLAGVGMSRLRGIAYIGLGLLIAYAWSGGPESTVRLPTSETVATSELAEERRLVSGDSARFGWEAHRDSAEFRVGSG